MMTNTSNNAVPSRRNTSTQSQYVRSSQSCGSAFNCGAEYAALQAQVEQLSERTEQLEYEKEQSRKYLQAATGLIKLQRFIMILLPIIELAVVGLVIYIFSEANIVGYTIIGLVGLTTLLNGWFLPNQMKSIEERISKIESSI